MAAGDAKVPGPTAKEENDEDEIPATERADPADFGSPQEGPPPDDGPDTDTGEEDDGPGAKPPQQSPMAESMGPSSDDDPLNAWAGATTTEQNASGSRGP
eukprot:3820642-Pyramimonas_sp.AAC.1